MTPEQIKKLQSKIGSPSDQSNLTVQEKNAKYLANLRQSIKEKSDLEEYKKTEEGSSFMDKLKNIGIGAGKKALSTLRGVSSLGEKVLQAPLKAVGVKFDDKTSAEKLIPKELTETEGAYQKIGGFGEQVAEFAIPLSKVSKATKGLSFAKQLLTRAVTSGGVATAQEGKIGKETAIASGVEVTLPVAGKVIKPVTNIIKRLFTGLGAGLSGASTQELEVIAKNPSIAQEFSNIIKKEGADSVLEKNAKMILNGISNIRKQARGAYGKGVEALSNVDIKPSIVKNNIVSAIDKNGIKATKTGLDFSNSEIFNNKIVSKAKELLTELNNKKDITGKTLRTYLDKLESSKFKSALDPDRQAFNNLIKDVSKNIKNAIKESTNKLDSINKKFSTNMSLAEGMESIFGKVNFKNTKELNNVARKLEGLFSKKGLDPKTIDDFLKRIGVSAEEFQTSQAVKNIATKTTGANTKGLSFAEILQQITSSVVTPETVKNIAIITGLSKNVIDEIIQKTAPTARAVIIKALMGENK